MYIDNNKNAQKNYWPHKNTIFVTYINLVHQTKFAIIQKGEPTALLA